MTTRLSQQKLDSKRLEYNTLTIHEVENPLRRTKQNHYEHGDKAGKLLPWQIREDASRVISSIKLPINTVVHSPEEINLIFREFYETLYKSEGDAPATMHEFLKKPNLQTLMMRIESTWRKR